MTKFTEEVAVEKLFDRYAGRTVQINEDAYHNQTVSPTDAAFNELKAGLEKMGFGVFAATNHMGSRPTGKVVVIGFDKQSDGKDRIAALYPTYQNDDGTYRFGAALKYNYTSQELQQKHDELTKKYSEIFNKFAGKEIQVVGALPQWLAPASSDTVAAEITEEIAAKTGKGTVFSIDENIGVRPSGVAYVQLDKGADNKYRVAGIR